MLEKHSKQKIDVLEGNATVKRLLKFDCIGFVTAVISNLAARFPPTHQGIVKYSILNAYQPYLLMKP